MPYRKTPFLWFLGGLVLLVVGATLWLMTAQPSEAQCGSQASSCKNCHEVQGQDPVNNDGTDWHKSHAFGDFCYICHGGNQQAADKDAAHAGMVAPLSDIEAGCQQCHPNDLQKRAQVYANALGIDLTSAGSAGPASSAPDTTTTNTTTTNTTTAPSALPVAAAPFTAKLSVDDPNMVDYTQRYNEIVLGERPVNWGNIAVIIIIELLVVGGGAFVVVNEIRRNTLRGKTRQVAGEYPEDVVAMLPVLAGLKSQTRQTLAKILANPQIDKVLGLIDAVVSHNKLDG